MPMKDNTSTDWFALRGTEKDGWTAIQFKRYLDTCDRMDVAIAVGSISIITFNVNMHENNKAACRSFLGWQQSSYLCLWFT
jgi:hypothetical protein